MEATLKDARHKSDEDIEREVVELARDIIKVLAEVLGSVVEISELIVNVEDARERKKAHKKQKMK